ncbi:hypothetical protein [Campylobacter sp.]|uniref:hypothetical protein n=1 Tax=Campylobacter sp. TaxID=205 RepID=UPI002706446C|nr:hypothetical protein [Campylobacter sp.]
MNIRDENSALKFLENLNSFSKTQKIIQGENAEFEKELESINLKSKSSLKSMDIENFRQNLTSMGALKFINYINELKIEERVEKKRAELIKTLGLDEEGIKSKTQSEIKELSSLLEEMIVKFRKELLASIQDNSLLEKQQKLSRRGSALSFALSIV